MTRTISISLPGMAKTSLVLAAGIALSACSAVNGRWSEYNYGYNDVRAEPVVFGAPNVGATGILGNSTLSTLSAASSGALVAPVPSPQQTLTAGAQLPVVRPGSVLPQLPRISTGFTTGPAAVRLGSLPPRMPLTSVLPTVGVQPPAPRISTSTPLVTTPRVTPTGLSEHAVCHSVSDSSAVPIGLPLSSFGYTARNFLTLPTATEYVQYLYAQRDLQPEDHAFANMAASFDPSQARLGYARNSLPTMVYRGTINRAVRLNDTQFLVDLAVIPGAPGGLHLCNLNGHLEIDRVDQNCCGQPLVIDRGLNPRTISTVRPLPVSTSVVTPSASRIVAPTSFLPSKTSMAPNLVTFPQPAQSLSGSGSGYSYSVTPTYSLTSANASSPAAGLMNILNIRQSGGMGEIGANGLGYFPGMAFGR